MPRINTFSYLAPAVRPQFDRLRDLLGPEWAAFETYRSPSRQYEMVQKGVSRALPMRSAHQYGLAVDFVPLVDGKLSWDVPTSVWNRLDDCAKDCGLVRPISWDRAHIEHPIWQIVRKHLLQNNRA